MEENPAPWKLGPLVAIVAAVLLLVPAAAQSRAVADSGPSVGACVMVDGPWPTDGPRPGAPPTDGGDGFQCVVDMTTSRVLCWPVVEDDGSPGEYCIDEYG